jgi:hypothetical protein
MANCNQPLADMLELLREEQGEGKVAKQEDGHNERNDSDEIESALAATSTSGRP